MSSITRNGTATPEPSGSDSAKSQGISTVIAALIGTMLSNAKSYDQAALRLEMDDATARRVNPLYVSFANDTIYHYRQQAASDIGAIAALLRDNMPHASFEERCDYLKTHLGFSSDDVNRIWNAFLAGY